MGYTLIYICFLSLVVTFFIVVVKREFLLLHKSYSEGVEMRKLSENEINKYLEVTEMTGQAELIAIGSLAGTFISPGFGSIAGAYIGDKVHSWATTATVSPSMSPSGIGLSSQFDPAEVHQVPLRLREWKLNLKVLIRGILEWFNLAIRN